MTSLDPRRRTAIVLAGVALAAVLVYLNSLANGFAYDDEFIIVSRPLVHGLDQLGAIVTAEYWPPEYHSGLYRPLTLLSFALEWQLWDGRPLGFHLVNLILHAAVSVLAALLLLRFFPWWAALAGAVVFAVHPVHTESVANIVGRAELLVALAVLAACLLYVRAVRHGPVSPGAVAAIAGLYLIAGFCKESGVVLPGLLLATDLPLLPGRDRDGWRAFVRRRLPLFLTLTLALALVFAARWAVLGSPIQSVPDRAFALDDSFATRLFTMARVWPRYFELLFLPLQLSADYSPAVILPATKLTPMGAVGFLLVLAAVALAVAAWRTAPELAMALAWFGIGMLPVSNLLITAEIVLAERTFYLPSVAVAIVAALALVRARPRARRWIAIAIGAWVVVFSVVTVRRNPVWESTNTVFEDLRRKHPESSRLLWGVGSQLLRAGNWSEAKKWFGRSLQVWPHHAPYKAEFAFYLFKAGELEEAERMAADAVELNPDLPEHHRFLALIRLALGDYEGALLAVQNAFRYVRPEAGFFEIQSEAYASLGAFERAVAAQRAVVRGRGDDAGWVEWLRLSALGAAAGDTSAALAALDSAVATPDARPEVADSLRRAWAHAK